MRTQLLSVENVKSFDTIQDSKGNTTRILKVEDEDERNPVKISVLCPEGQTLADAKCEALRIYITMQQTALERELAKIVAEDRGDIHVEYRDGEGWYICQEPIDFGDDGCTLAGRGVLEVLQFAKMHLS